MRKRSEVTKQLLEYFGLMVKDTEGFLGFPSDFNKRIHEMSFFNSVFNVDSPFGVSCEACDAKFRQHINSATPEEEINAENEPVLDTRMPRPPSPCQRTKANAPNPSDIQREITYDIYISKFHPSTQCSQIVNLIREKTDLNEDCFDVVKLVRNGTKNKIHFISFKISAQSSETFDILMNNELWAPDFFATRFIQNYSKKPKKQKPVNQVEQKTKQPKRNKQRQHNKKQQTQTHQQKIHKPNVQQPKQHNHQKYLNYNQGNYGLKPRHTYTNRLLENHHNQMSNSCNNCHMPQFQYHPQFQAGVRSDNNNNRQF